MGLRFATRSATALGAAQPTLLAELQSLLTKRNLGIFDPDRGAESIARMERRQDIEKERKLAAQLATL